MTRRIVRRVYSYIAACIGLQMSAAGLSDLLGYAAERGFGAQPLADPGTAALRLSSNIALLLVGVALWAGHWLLVQSDARSEEGRASVLRRLYAYVVLLVAAIAVLIGMQEFFALLLESLTQRASAEGLVYPLANILVYGAVWGAHYTLFAAERPKIEATGPNATVRRWYFFLVRAWSLSFAAGGAGMLIYFLVQRYIFGAVGWWWQFSQPAATMLAGVLIWAPHEHWAQHLIRQPNPLQADELRSVLRQVFSALVITIALIATLTGLAALLAAGLQTVFGLVRWSVAFADEVRGLAALIVATPILIYHYRRLLSNAQISGEPARIDTARRVIMYLVGAVSIAALYAGLGGSLGSLLRLWLQGGSLGVTQQTALCWYLATATVALPVYTVVVRRSEALVHLNSLEEHLLGRRIYLYAGLLFGVIATAVTTTRLIQLIVVAILGQGDRNVSGDIGWITAFAVLSGIVAWLYAAWLRRAGISRDTAGNGRVIALIGAEPLLTAISAAISAEIPGSTLKTLDRDDSPERRTLLAGSDVLIVTPGVALDASLDRFAGPRLIAALAPQGNVIVGAHREAAVLRELAREVRRICLALPAHHSLVAVQPTAAATGS